MIEKSIPLERMCSQLQGDLEELKRQIEKFKHLQKRRDEEEDEGDEWKKE